MHATFVLRCQSTREFADLFGVSSTIIYFIGIFIYLLYLFIYLFYFLFIIILILTNIDIPYKMTFLLQLIKLANQMATHLFAQFFFIKRYNL